MVTDEANPQDWYFLAADRLRAADIIFTAIGATPVVFAQHYPGSDLAELGADYGELRGETDTLLILIKQYAI